MTARLLLVVLVPGLGLVGGVAGSWIVPSILALAHDGVQGVYDLPVSHRLVANLPAWLDPHRERLLYSAAGLVYGLVILAGCAICGFAGGQVWRYMVVKLHLMTEEEVREVNNRDPGF
jgi:hypothetical protein